MSGLQFKIPLIILVAKLASLVLEFLSDKLVGLSSWASIGWEDSDPILASLQKRLNFRSLCSCSNHNVSIM